MRGFRDAGYDPTTVTLASAARGYAEPVAIAPNQGALSDPGFYRSLDAKAAIIINWLGMPDVVAAAKAGCGKLIALADSDGLVGVRVHPGATFSRMVYQHTDRLTKMRAAVYWLRLYVRGPQVLDQPVLQSCGHADRVVVCDPVAAENLQVFFKSYRREDLSAKLACVPYPVDECFLNNHVRARRSRMVVAVGRWDDPQKDAPLMCKGVQRYLDRGGQCEFAFVGPGGENAFGRLRSKCKAVRVCGVIGPTQLADLMNESRILLLASRWESGPLVLFEALARGCTVVGPASIPGVQSALSAGPYGAVFKHRSARAIAAALEQEMAAWDAGSRDPEAIATRWRPQFEPRNVCLQLLDSIPLLCQLSQSSS